MKSVLRKYSTGTIEDDHSQQSLIQDSTFSSLNKVSAQIALKYVSVYLESLRIVGLMLFKDQQNLHSFFFYSFIQGIKEAISFLDDQNQSEAILGGLSNESIKEALSKYGLDQVKSPIVLRKLHKLSEIGFIAGIQSSLEI